MATLGDDGWMKREAIADLSNGLNDGSKPSETLTDLQKRIKRDFRTLFNDQYVIVTFSSLSELHIKSSKGKKRLVQPLAIGIGQNTFLRGRPGIYGYITEENKWYIGEAKNLAERFSQHYYDPHKLGKNSFGFAICKIRGLRGEDLLLNPGVRKVLETGVKVMFDSGGAKCSFAYTKSGAPRRDSYQVISEEARIHCEEFLTHFGTIINKNSRKRIIVFRSTIPNKVATGTKLFVKF
jgi:hypothetical protein